jgi:hypothetical protein
MKNPAKNREAHSCSCRGAHTSSRGGVAHPSCPERNQVHDMPNAAMKSQRQAGKGRSYQPWHDGKRGWMHQRMTANGDSPRNEEKKGR